jgi:hypothetical protein
MSTATLPHPSRLRICWLAWLAIVVCFLLVRFALPSRFSYLAVTYALITWLPIMALHYLQGRRLLAHLKAYHHDRWEYLTWAFGAPGGRNDFRMLPWLLSGEDYGDPTLAALKSQQRRWLLFVLVVFLSYPVLTPILNAPPIA